MENIFMFFLIILMFLEIIVGIIIVLILIDLFIENRRDKDENFS